MNWSEKCERPDGGINGVHYAPGSQGPNQTSKLTHLFFISNTTSPAIKCNIVLFWVKGEGTHQTLFSKQNRVESLEFYIHDRSDQKKQAAVVVISFRPWKLLLNAQQSVWCAPLPPPESLDSVLLLLHIPCATITQSLLFSLICAQADCSAPAYTAANNNKQF